MTAYVRLYPDTFYVNGNPVPKEYFQGIDTTQYEAIDGDAGGTWAPDGPIVIGGAGMWAAGYWGFPSLVVPNIQVAAGASQRLTHGDSDWVVLGAGHAMSSRTLPTTLGPSADGGYYTAGQAANGVPQTTYTYGTSIRPPQDMVGGGRFQMPIRVHHGAKLTTVTVYFKIASRSGGVTDLQFPQVRVLRVGMDGSAVALCSDATVAGWNGRGWVSLFPVPPVSSAAYYALGAAQSGVYTCDAGTIIDTSRYAYVLQVQDEYSPSGVGHGGNYYFAAYAAFTSIPDFRPQ